MLGGWGGVGVAAVDSYHCERDHCIIDYIE